MQKQFTHIISHMRALGKTFQNEEMVVKFLRFLNSSWKPKFIVISEFRDLPIMDMDTLFGKFNEHEMKLKILIDDEEEDNKKKILVLKVEEDRRIMTPIKRCF